MDYVAAMDTTIPGLTRSRKDEALKKLVNDSWLAHDRRKLELGIRSQIGLRGYIEEQYGNLDDPVLIECVLCQEFVLKGECCPNQPCQVRMHGHCSEKWFATKPTRKCPTCDGPWV